MKEQDNCHLTSFSVASGHSCIVACFNKHGGLSNGLFNSLNVGRLVGDASSAVEKNRLQIKETIGAASVLSARQVHGNEIYCLQDTLASDLEIEAVDALITNKPGVALMIQQADCQAVLLFDPMQGVIAAVHCGWRGNVQGLLPRTVEKMQEQYGTLPADLKVVISPSLGPGCAEFIHYQKELPIAFHQFMVGKSYFDFWQISKFQLSCSGVLEKNIQITGLCTCCSDDYFSYRRAKILSDGVTGRNCSLILLGKDHESI